MVKLRDLQMKRLIKTTALVVTQKIMQSNQILLRVKKISTASNTIAKVTLRLMKMIKYQILKRL